MRVLRIVVHLHAQNVFTVIHMDRHTIRTVIIEGHVRSGFSFRERVVNDASGTVAVIQMKDLNGAHFGIHEGGIARVQGKDIGPQHFLAKGDVLFVAKGANNRAVVYDMDQKAVAASAFFVLRPDPAKVDPHYLAWWINQKPVQEYLQQNMAGTYIPNITKPVVEGISVPLPPLDQQRLIAVVHQLSLREQSIRATIARRRAALVDRILMTTTRTFT
ncbi:MAG: restriction endonuclease subunit S [Flavobacteriales bacterium]